jgi:hypothetical protein
MSKERWLVALLLVLTGSLAAPTAASALRLEPAAGSPISGVGHISDIASADFNGDDEDDLVLASGSSPFGLAVQLSNSDGTFTPAATIDPGAPGYYGAWTGDFNGDGKMDIVAQPYTQLVLKTYLGAGDGTFSFSQQTYMPDNGLGSRDSLAVGDMNNDGRDDLVVGHAGSDISTAIANPGGGFTFYSQIGGGSNYKGAAIGDLNADGVLDAVVATSTQVFPLRGNGTGIFSQIAGPTSMPAPYDQINSLASADFDGDGRADIAAASGSSTENSDVVQTFFGQNDTSLLLNPNFFGAVHSNMDLSGVHAGEFNGNGKADLAYVTSEPSCDCPDPVRGAGVALGNGIGWFVPATGSPFRGGDPQFAPVWQMTTGDFDGNGATDLAISIFGGSGGAKVLLNTADLISDDSSVQFGDQKVNTSSAFELPDLVNDGGPDIDVTGITIEGADAGQFSLSPSSQACLGVIPPVQRCQIGVRFSPTSTGDKSARIEVEYAQSETPFTLDLTGKGVASAASPSPANLGFGSIRINTTRTETVTVNSTGDAVLEIGQLGLTGDDAARFSISDDNCSDEDIPPGEDCTVKVTAAPTATGDIDAALEFPNDGNGVSQVPLAATGINPGLDVAPTSYDFVEGEVNGPGQGNSFTITSSGTTPLVVDDISVGGPDASDFSLAGSGCIGTPHTTGQTCSFTGIFHPDAGPVDARSATFIIESNAGQTTVPVTGTATYGDTVITPDPVEFGQVKIDGETVTRTVTLSAEGTASMYVDEIAVTGGHPELFEIVEDGCSGQQTPAGDSCAVDIRFDPDSIGDKASSLTVDTFSQVQSTELSASGIDPAGSLTPASHDFGAADIGVTYGHPTKDFILKSTGTTPLEVQNFFDGGTENSFTIAGAEACVRAVAPGTSCQVSVTFDPKSGEPGERNGQFAFGTNAGQMAATYRGEATKLPDPPETVEASLKLKAPGKVKRGRKLTVTATVKNTGTTVISGLVLKTTVAKKLARKPKTIKVSSLAPGASVKRKIKVAVKKSAKAGKKLKVTVAASAAGKKLAAASRSAKIKK